jgi:hypothetical protein
VTEATSGRVSVLKGEAQVTTVSLVVIFSGEVRGSDQPGEEHEVASVAA